MTFEEIQKLVDKGASLLQQGRAVFSQVKSAVADGKTAINAVSMDALLAQLEREEAETKAAVADARDAIAEYRRG